MKKTRFIMSSLFLIFAASATLVALPAPQDITHEIPEIKPTIKGYEKIEDVAQSGHDGWDQVVGIAKHVSLDEARLIADSDPEITFFFFMKGGQMVLGTGDGHHYRIFRHGDAVFFKGEPKWGSAHDFADGYIKK